MQSFNKITIVGYLGRDPELKYANQDVPVCTFSVATSERKAGSKPGDKNGETTTWFRITFWREKAELANKYLKTGSKVYIEGKLKAREWQDREGITRTSLEVTGTELHFLDSKDEDAGKGNAAPAARREAASAGRAEPPAGGSGPDITEDDIPF